MIDNPSDSDMTKSDNAELIARLRSKKAMYTNDYGWSWRQSTVSDVDCQAAADALAKAEAQIAIKDNILTISRLAREAGEARGKLEISEAAGIVEGWRERAEAAEVQVAELERAYEGCDARACAATQQSVDLLNRAEAAEARATALEARIKALEEALNKLATWDIPAHGERVSLLSVIARMGIFARAALAQSGEG